MTPEASARRASTRRSALRRGALALGIFGAVLIGAALLPPDAARVDHLTRDLPPSPIHLFGTDSLGRDMAARTLAALAVSVQVGLLAAALSTAIATALGLAAALGRTADRLVGLATELALGLPHFLLIMLVAFALGGGFAGVILGVGLTHWPRLARLLRHEARSLAASDCVAVSRALGRSRIWIARRHLAPHLLPQIIAGFVLIFPHAILHEAGLSFVGLGIQPHLPSIGVLLAESLRAIMAGRWWIAFFPGAALMLVALVFEVFGESLRRAADPAEGVA